MELLKHGLKKVEEFWGKKFKKIPHGFNAELNFLNPNISVFFAHLFF